MLRFRATVAEERWMALRRRARAWRKAELLSAEALAKIEARPVEWRESSLLLRVMLFGLTVFAVAVTQSWLRPDEIVLAILCAFAAEALIAGRRFLHVGPEEALWGCACGLALLNLGEAPNELVVGVTLLLAGWRTLSEPLIVFGLILVGGYDAAAAVVPLILGVLALGVRTLRLRPHLDTALALFALIVPLQASIEELSVPMLTMYAVVALLIAIARRSRVAFAAAAIAATIVTIELTRRVDLPLEWKLLAGGIVLFALAATLERVLRVPRRGITSQRMTGDDLVDLLPVLTAPAMTPATAPHEKNELKTGGGGFGGAGSSSDF